MAALLKRRTQKRAEPEVFEKLPAHDAPDEKHGVRTAWARVLDDAAGTTAPRAVAPRYRRGAEPFEDLAVVESLLSERECARLVAEAEAEGFGKTPFPRE